MSYPVLYPPASPLPTHTSVPICVALLKWWWAVPTLSLWGIHQMSPNQCSSCPQHPKTDHPHFDGCLRWRQFFCLGLLWSTAKQLNNQVLGCSSCIINNTTLNGVKGTHGAIWSYWLRRQYQHVFGVSEIKALWIKAFHSAHSVLISHKQLKANVKRIEPIE